MKRIIGWAIMASLALTAAQTNGQNTNLNLEILNLNFGLKALTNGLATTNDNTVTLKNGAQKIGSREIIESLSGQRSFPLVKALDGDTNAYLAKAAAVMTNFSSSAKLIIIQVLGVGTNHDNFFIAVRDGHSAVDYDVSEYFNTRTFGFSGFPQQRHIDSGRFKADTGEEHTTRVSDEEFDFDNGLGGASRLAFSVEGIATEFRTGVTVNGTLVEPAATRSFTLSATGTGAVNGSFAVIKGNINAVGARLEHR